MERERKIDYPRPTVRRYGFGWVIVWDRADARVWWDGSCWTTRGPCGHSGNLSTFGYPLYYACRADADAEVACGFEQSGTCSLEICHEQDEN